MELTDFAGKQFAVYGKFPFMAFNGDNVKHISKEDDGIVTGYNERDGEEWGDFWVWQIGDEIIFDYNSPDNPWHIQRLTDKNFRQVTVHNMPEKYKSMLKEGPLDVNRLCIQAVAYWSGIRWGKFWMVEVTTPTTKDRGL